MAEIALDGPATTAPEQRLGASLPPYRPSLDGLRAIAVLSVLFYHLGYRWMRGSFLGVDIFFVLSGYLITSILAAEIYGRGSRPDCHVRGSSDHITLEYDAIIDRVAARHPGTMSVISLASYVCPNDYCCPKSMGGYFAMTDCTSQRTGRIG